MVRWVRTLMVSIGLCLSALIAVPVGSELAVEHLNLSASSPLGHLAVTTAGACGNRINRTGFADHYDGGTGTYVKESIWDWFDGCSAGNYTITAQCWGRCGGYRQGSFWDASRWANTDWVNYQTYGQFWEPECVWLRYWTQPNGVSYWASGENFGWC